MPVLLVSRYCDTFSLTRNNEVVLSGKQYTRRWLTPASSTICLVPGVPAGTRRDGESLPLETTIRRTPRPPHCAKMVKETNNRDVVTRKYAIETLKQRARPPFARTFPSQLHDIDVRTRHVVAQLHLGDRCWCYKEFNAR